MLRVHHLDCGTCCPMGGRLMDGRSAGAHGHLVCHCLAIETDAGLVLVDTGWGVRDLEAPAARLSKLNVALLNPVRDPERAMVRRLARLGFKPADVRHVVLTHLDFDHAGGLVDLPHARVHLLAAELGAAEERRGFIARNRYVPMQWGPLERFSTYAPDGGEPWYGFEAVRDMPGLPPEILLVPLPGHTLGHAAVAVRAGEGWLLHAGDAFFHEDEMRLDRPSCPPGLRFYQRMMEADRGRRLRNQERLRDLARAQGPAVRVLCSHDAAMLARWQAAGGAALAPATAPALARA